MQLGQAAINNCSVLLQAMKQDPAPDARCRDKFLVQSTAITADKEFASVAAVVFTLQSNLQSNFS